MNLLLDTHVLLWAAGAPERRSIATQNLLDDTSHNVFFSVASIWEITIKHGLQRDDFKIDPRLLRRGLLDNGYNELDISSEHCLKSFDKRGECISQSCPLFKREPGQLKDRHALHALKTPGSLTGF